MLSKRVTIYPDNIPIKIRCRKNLIVKGKNRVFADNIHFDVEYKNICKNIMITSRIKAKMDSGNKEIHFYFRYQDEKNYCCFCIKYGVWMQFSVVANGSSILKTSRLRITNNNLFNNKYSFILSVFEQTTSVFVNDKIVLNIDDTPKIEGKVGIQFICTKNEEFNLVMKNLHFTEEVLNFEPIIEMPKSPDIYFMHANDFYEQNKYEIALIYYHKGLLFGQGDEKIYTRTGNLMFFIDEYEEAASYYQKALKISPDNSTIVYLLANTLFYMKNYNKALELLNNFYKQLPNNGQKDNLLGNIYLALQRYKEAKHYYLNAINVQPKNIEYKIKLAEFYYKVKNYLNGYKITKQLVKDGKLDRAANIHLKLKSNCVITLSCSKCHIKWSILKNNHDVVFHKEKLKDLPLNAPAGVCPKCKRVYCKTCVKGKRGKKNACLNCGNVLKYNSPVLRIIANKILRNKND